jgi:hypothetical protein
MRPSLGVLAEVVVLSAVIGATAVVPEGLFLGVYLIVTLLLATYLIHCPAHYIVGTLARIRFKEMRLGRTTIARVLPKPLASYAKLLPVLILVADRDSVARVSRARGASMYASGALASVSSALVIAAAATLVEPALYAVLAWVVALAYLLFDVAFSPKSGDLMRARRVLRAPPRSVRHRGRGVSPAAVVQTGLGS